MSLLNMNRSRWGVIGIIVLVISIYGCVSVISFEVNEDDENQLVHPG